MKNIAIFQEDLNIGGIQKSLINFLNNIDYKKYNIDLYLFNKNNKLINDVNKNVNIIYLKRLNKISKLISFNILKKIYKCNINKSYDISIDYNSYSMNTSLNTILVDSKKRIMWVHNDIEKKLNNEFKYRVLYNRFKSKFKYYDKFICVSTGALESFKKLNKLDKEFSVIPNIIDTKIIKNKMNDKVNIKFNDKVINICSVGRLVYQKGFDLLINDFKKVIDKNKRYHLYIIGNGSEYKNLKTLINDLELDKYITLVGEVSNPYSIMNKCDAFVLTSRYEGQGIVIMEATSIGLDVIIPEYLEKYVDGIKGSNNIVNDILNIKKHKHKFNSLDKYNKKIVDMINKI